VHEEPSYARIKTRLNAYKPVCVGHFCYLIVIMLCFCRSVYHFNRPTIKPTATRAAELRSEMTLGICQKKDPV
jgi:hypothetical protein